ncbi:sigma-70 family RNA polymerase sigma factor [Rhabdothermincola salaria]|uniref:sigma-70 family RNA polymerase sigma factor n=1 Tax=Rhabdothermincola salaria TaxID=2903142 RepID=UPI001E5723E4|nr:sigma-70 family RNA polymerase sigma factor [Rhabdothermincola salaria]MCD9624214.1 sigma-70 family RNA polymerase sigma factor [Rhabdothermincola salaria]
MDMRPATETAFDPTRTAWRDNTDDAGAPTETDRFSRAVVLCLDWCGTEGLDRHMVDDIADEVGLATTDVPGLVRALRHTGVAVTPGEEPDEPGWSGGGTKRVLKMCPIDLLSARQERQLAVGVREGVQAREALNAGGDVLNPGDRRQLRAVVARGERARDQLVLHNVRLVHSTAAKYRSRAGNTLEIDDLFQEGYFGLRKAVEAFDPSRGFRFSTYAMPWIRQSINRAIDNTARLIRLPVHRADSVRNAIAEERAFERFFHRAPTDPELAERLGIDLEACRQLRALACRPVPVHLPDVDDGYLRTLETGEHLQIDPTIAVDDRAAADWFLARLNEREQTILRRRFGLDTGEAETLDAIGRSMGLTRERIRQIEKAALEQLRALAQSENETEAAPTPCQPGRRRPRRRAQRLVAVVAADQVADEADPDAANTDRSAPPNDEKPIVDDGYRFVPSVDVDAVRPMNPGTEVSDIDLAPAAVFDGTVTEIARRLEVVESLAKTGLITPDERNQTRHHILLAV